MQTCQFQIVQGSTDARYAVGDIFFNRLRLLRDILAVRLAIQGVAVLQRYHG